MKSQKIFILLFFILVFFSCTKEGDKASNCLISTITESGSAGNRITNITYNNEGKVSTISATGIDEYSKVLNYSGNTIIATTTTINGNNSQSSIDSITVDNQGRPLNIRQYNPTRTSWINTSFEYNGEELVRSLRTTSSSATPLIVTAFYSNGNIIRAESAFGNSVYEYYEDEPVQQGDWLGVLSLTIYGIKLYSQKNLVKTYDAGGGNIFNFIYEMNNDGLISKVNVTGGTVIGTLAYQYQCN